MQKPTWINKTSLIVGAIVGILTISSAGLRATVWAADQRYVTQEALSNEFKNQRLQKLSDEIDELELKKVYNVATNVDLAKLEKLKRKYETLIKTMTKD